MPGVTAAIALFERYGLRLAIAFVVSAPADRRRLRPARPGPGIEVRCFGPGGGFGASPAAGCVPPPRPAGSV